MPVYFPIAGLSLDLFIPLTLGLGVGILTGMFGVGGGFLMTPVLIFCGVSPAVAVATGTANFAGASVSGAIAHWRRGNVDVKMGLVLLAGGIVGSIVGVRIFAWMRSLGQIDTAISILYAVVLCGVGGIMLLESLRSLWRPTDATGGPPRSRRAASPTWAQRLPFAMSFPHSRLNISPIAPFLLGALVGLLSALMGVGGGFIMVPVMIYLLRMPTKVVIGTSLFQIIFVTSGTALMQAIENHTVDIALAYTLLIGGVFGAQIGTWASGKLAAEHLRVLLAILVLGVGLRMGATLFLPPDLPYMVVTKRVGP